MELRWPPSLRQGTRAVHVGRMRNGRISWFWMLRCQRKAGWKRQGEIRRFLPMVRILILTAFRGIQDAKRAIRIG